MDACAQAAAGMNDRRAKYARLPAGGRSWELRKIFAKGSRAEPVLHTEARASAREWRQDRETICRDQSLQCPGSFNKIQRRMVGKDVEATPIN